MDINTQLQKLSALDRIYVGVRLLLLTLSWIGLFIVPHTAQWTPGQSFIYLVVMIVFTILSLAFCALLLRYPDKHGLLYFLMLTPDILFIGLSTRFSGGPESIFYLGYFILTAVYCLYFSLRIGVLVGAMSAAAFTAFNFEALLSERWYDMSVKAGIIVGVAFIISRITEIGRLEKIEVKNLNEALSLANSELQKKLTELHAISEMAMVIHSTLDFDALAKLVLDLLQKVLNLRRCALMIVDKKKGEIMFSAAQGLPRKTAEGLMMGAVANREGVSFTHDPVEDASATLANGGGPAVATDNTAVATESEEFLKCIPILNQEKVLGILCTESEPINELSSDDMVVLAAVANELAVAVENSRLFELAKKLAITDELTDLFNYRYLQERLQAEIERAQRYERPLSLMMIDMDDFKLYNDTYGHLQGDQALAEIAELFRANSRESDIIARYGGEEFCFLLPETDVSGVFVAAEKLREIVSEHRFLGRGGQRTVQLTISLGVATHPVHAGNVNDLLREADDALYIAKTTGRNRVCAPREEGQ